MEYVLKNNPHVIPYRKIRERLTNIYILDGLLLILIGFRMEPYQVYVQSTILLCKSIKQKM